MDTLRSVIVYYCHTILHRSVLLHKLIQPNITFHILATLHKLPDNLTYS